MVQVLLPHVDSHPDKYLTERTEVFNLLSRDLYVGWEEPEVQLWPGGGRSKVCCRKAEMRRNSTSVNFKKSGHAVAPHECAARLARLPHPSPHASRPRRRVPPFINRDFRRPGSQQQIDRQFR